MKTTRATLEKHMDQCKAYYDFKSFMRVKNITIGPELKFRQLFRLHGLSIHAMCLPSVLPHSTTSESVLQHLPIQRLQF